MSSNLFKYGYNYIPLDDKRIIDSNAALAALEQKIGGQSRKSDAASEQVTEGFAEGLNAEKMDLLFEEEQDSSSSVIKQPEYEGPTVEELLAEAEQEIDRMKKTAEAEIIVERKKVMEQSRTQGYQEGYEKGQKEADALKRQLKQERQRLETEYEEKLNNMEPQLISILTEVYEHILQVDFASYRQIIVTLISNTLHQIEGGKNYIIHVSASDYPYVTMQKAQIITNCPASVLVEFVEDISLKQNECLIETDTGIFDCGLGTQLEELKKKLRLLSFER